MARAVANLTILSELCIPFVKINGYFIAMKGNVEFELKEAKKAIEFLGGIEEEIFTFYLKGNIDLRNIVVIYKQNESPIGYPRCYDKIIKKPIK